MKSSHVITIFIILQAVFAKKKTRPRTCKNFGCSHACKMNQFNRPICLCPKGFDLIGSRIKCKRVTNCQVTKKCFCKNGEPLPHEECSKNKAHECLYCHGSFHVDQYTKKCVRNKCKCTNGYPVDDADCTYHNHEQCSSCFRSGFHLEAEHCIKNQCYCNHGISDSDPKSNEACGEHGREECFRCDVGYMIGGENDEKCIPAKHKNFKNKYFD